MDKKQFSVNELVSTSMLIALVVVLTFIKIPFGGAMVHLGSAAIFLAGILFGPKKAAAAGAIGSVIFDLIVGQGAYTLWSLIIKGLAGYTAGSIAWLGEAKGRSLTKNVLAVLAAAAVTLVGYEIAWAVVGGSIQFAIANIPASLLTSSLGALVALPLYRPLRAALVKAKLITD